MAGRRSADEARDTRNRILAQGVEQASAVGLTGLTIGPLASAVQMSKAGVIGPFGTRDGLQLAVLHEAVERFVAAVVSPTADREDGLPRLEAILDRWVDYLAHGPFVHGCFITATSCELTGQPGPLLDRTADVVRAWRELLHGQLRAAVARGEVAADLEAEGVVTALIGLSMACNQEVHLLGDQTAPDRTRTLMRRVVDERRLRTGPSRSGELAHLE